MLDRTSLSLSERKAYSDAVLCLMSKPSKFAPGLVPGAKNRYDDFVAIHINNTLSIHATVCQITSCPIEDFTAKIT
jgi:tyrosinase